MGKINKKKINDEKARRIRLINSRNPFIPYLKHVRKAMMRKNKDLKGEEGQQKIMLEAKRCWRKMTKAQKDQWGKEPCDRQPIRPCQRCPTCKQIIPDKKNTDQGRMPIKNNKKK